MSFHILVDLVVVLEPIVYLKTETACYTGCVSYVSFLNSQSFQIIYPELKVFLVGFDGFQLLVDEGY